MINDARCVAPETVIKTDVCIVGGGAAGITLARELANSHLQVCLLESGGLQRDEATQGLYEGEIIGLPYDLMATRSRFLGGSSNCWGGFCRPFESHLFQARPWVPDSGWPINAAMMEEYYDRAHRMCGLDPKGYDVKERLAAVRGHHLRPMRLGNDRLITSLAQLNKERRRLGSFYRRELKDSPNIAVYLYANAVELRSSAGGGAIQKLRVACLSGNTFQVAARIYVLACGAIDNARLLLASNAVETAGVGNRHDLVGRYFMEHPTRPVAEVTLNPDARQSVTAYIDRFALMRLPVAAELNIPFATQRREQMLDSAMHVELELIGENSPSTAAAKEIFGDLWRGCPPREPMQRLRALMSDPLAGLAFAGGLFTAANALVKRRRLVVSTEQCPNPDSRITLSDERDALGMPRVRLDWRLNSLDRHTMSRTAEILQEDLRRSGIVEASALLIDDDCAEGPRWNWHHIGTTRMHQNPRHGVVDADCRVHGVGNLYIAGSSVFPTAGNHTPTLTIIALAMRTADHLRRVLARPVGAAAFCRPSGQTAGKMGLETAQAARISISRFLPSRPSSASA